MPMMSRTTDEMTNCDTPNETRDETARRDGGKNELVKTEQDVGNTRSANETSG